MSASWTRNELLNFHFMCTQHHSSESCEMEILLFAPLSLCRSGKDVVGANKWPAFSPWFWQTSDKMRDIYDFFQRTKRNFTEREKSMTMTIMKTAEKTVSTNKLDWGATEMRQATSFALSSSPQTCSSCQGAKFMSKSVQLRMSLCLCRAQKTISSCQCRYICFASMQRVSRQIEMISQIFLPRNNHRKDIVKSSEMKARKR